MDRVIDLLGADEVDMAVEAAGRQDAPLARDDFGAGADDQGHAGLGVGVARLADARDAPVLQADIGLHDALMVEDDDPGDDRVHRAALAGDLRLAHAVAHDLAAAELDLFAGDGQVAFDLDQQFGIGQPDAVARGRAVKRRIIGTGQGLGHVTAPP